MTHTEEPPMVHRAIRERIKQLRTDRKWSAQKLGEEMARVGIPWNRSIVVNIEQGRRSYITVEELVALGRVLGVPPMLLAFPFDQVRDIQVLPNVSAPAWDAAEWFAGRAPFPHWQKRDGMGEVIAEVGDAADLEAFEQGAVAFELWETHQAQVKGWRQRTWEERLARRQAENAAGEAQREELLQKARAAELAADSIANALWETRRRLRQHGILAPELPEALQHIDTEKTPLHRAIERHYDKHPEGGDGHGGPDQAD